MGFEKNYPYLAQFFGAYFPDSDFESLTDEEVVANYISDCIRSEKSKADMKKTKAELEDLMDHVELYWEEVGQEANRYFRNSGEALDWLKMIKQNLP